MPMQMPVSFDIRACFKALGEGDSSEFEPLFAHYRKKVFGVAFKMLKDRTDAEEIVQEVFLSLWLSRARLGDVEDPEAYLFTTTFHAVSRELKRIARNSELIEAVIRRMAGTQENIEQGITVKEAGQLVRKALQKLPPQQRTVYELSKLQGLSYFEIARHMHLSEHTVRNHLSVASKTIRKILKKSAIFSGSLPVPLEIFLSCW